MIGVIVNTLTVLLGSTIGLIFKKGIPEKVSSTVMVALGLCTMYIGIDGSLKGDNTIVLIVSMVIGTVIGSIIDLDDKLNRLGNTLEHKLKRTDGKTSIAEGFVTASLLFCIGSMTIVGSINSGLRGDHELIFTKSTLDLISSCMLASTLGVGVMFAAVFVFIFQGALVLGSSLLQTVLTNEAIINEITSAGSVMIIGLGLNLVGISKFKIANMLPAIFIVPIIFYLAQYLPL